MPEPSFDPPQNEQPPLINREIKNSDDALSAWDQVQAAILLKKGTPEYRRMIMALAEAQAAYQKDIETKASDPENPHQKEYETYRRYKMFHASNGSGDMHDEERPFDIEGDFPGGETQIYINRLVDIVEKP
jgi:hypothetical protein